MDFWSELIFGFYSDSRWLNLNSFDLFPIPLVLVVPLQYSHDFGIYNPFHTADYIQIRILLLHIHIQSGKKECKYLHLAHKFDRSLTKWLLIKDMFSF